MANPTIAIVGRPNVGKSTIFNRIAGERISIVEDTPGVTRDRIYAKGEWLGREFSVIDTGGIDLGDEPFMDQIKHQAEIAIEEADVIICVVSGREGVTDADEMVAKILYRSNKPVILAVNKVDNPEMRNDIYEFYSLGLGDPYPVSGSHGLGIGDILDEEDDEELILEWLNLFSKYKQKQILDEVSHDVITDVIGSIEDEDEKNAFLELLEDDDKEDVKQLLKYNPETAGGIMTTEYLDIHAKNTVKETLLFLQTTDEEPRHYLYVVDKDNILKGVVSLGDIVTSSFDTQMMDITNQNVKAVYYYQDQEEVAKVFSKYGYILMPVIDEQHHLLGVIDIDDVMDVIEEETTEDMNLLGGVGSEERLDSTLTESFKNRIPWLIVNLFTAIMASSVVSVFEGTIAKVVALATISPIITGMGGNAGTQTLTIVVRGLSLGELDKENARKVLLKEIGLGILNGIIIGALVSLGAWFFAGNPWFGVVAGLAMICNMVVATLAGYFVPVILDRLHVDPALASGVFVTTFTDMFGFFAFLGLATILMIHLI